MSILIRWRRDRVLVYVVCGHVKHSTSGRHRLLTENVSGNFLIWGRFTLCPRVLASCYLALNTSCGGRIYLGEPASACASDVNVWFIIMVRQGAPLVLLSIFRIF
ncbi:hypothetical protein BDV34DRAFT_206986 [Aspergillus parasiticus]|uniref:Uncharacterized protein n=1 Tax=Aspergillus parasiticus TaxID=5067 RepID=A0A5N6D281_ASPPA|nr:hypothetical protein BDV34DRAFT_206986 [Aspergillus parasiticus]